MTTGDGEGDPRPRRTGPVPGVQMHGALPVIARRLHDQWCRSDWAMTRLADAPNLAICPGCGCAVRVH